MTPTETATILRQFNEWRRGDEDIPQPDPREIGEAIDAAIAMIDHLEAAESDALEQARLNGVGSEREAALMVKLEAAEKERDNANAAAVGVALQVGTLQAEHDTLRAKVEAMERKEPVATVRINAINGNPSVDFVPGHHYLHHNDKLYLAPGAKGE